MLTDPEAEEIAREVQRGTKGPVVFTWIEQLLADRKERVAQVHFLRQRLKQAFVYLDGLLEGKKVKPMSCPKCGKPYVRASGLSPNGMVYFHADRSECRLTGNGRP